MQFTLIPQPNSPLGGQAVYRLENNTPQSVDIRIRTEAGALLGAKRFVNTTLAETDAAPYLRPALDFVVPSGGTGFYTPQGRTLTACLEAEETGTTGSAVATPLRTFLPTDRVRTAPALISEMPLQRIIADGEADELTLLLPGAWVATVTAQGGDSTSAQSYRTTVAGLHLFRLDTRDYPQSETLIVDAGSAGAVAYTVVAPPAEGVRLAWRTRSGSVEHYTFPVIKKIVAEVEKSRAYGAEGHISRITDSQRRTILRSAYETRTVLEALAGLITSPQVWKITEGQYLPVDVLTPKAEVYRSGEFGALEIEIRPTRKNDPR